MKTIFGRHLTKKQDRGPALAAKKSAPGAAKRSEELSRRIAEARKAVTREEDSGITAAALSDPDAQPVDALFRKRGRPRLAHPKRPVLLRLDPDVVEHFKAGGDGWQTRMNAALRKAAHLE